MGSRRDLVSTRRPARRFRVTSVLPFAALCWTAFAAPAAGAGQRFGMVGCQFHNYDMPRIEEAIERAPEYGVNFVVLSHGLVGAANQVLDEPVDE